MQSLAALNMGVTSPFTSGQLARALDMCYGDSDSDSERRRAASGDVVFSFFALEMCVFYYCRT